MSRVGLWEDQPWLINDDEDATYLLMRNMYDNDVEKYLRQDTMVL